MKHTINLKEGTDYNILPSTAPDAATFGKLATDSLLWILAGMFKIIFKIILFILKSIFYTFLLKTLLLPVLAWFLKRLENLIDSFLSSVFRTLGFFAVLAGIIYCILKYYHIL